MEYIMLQQYEQSAEEYRFLHRWFGIKTSAANKKIDLESYVEYLSLLCRYGGFAHFEVEKGGREYIITLLHTYGQKWSTYLMSFVDEVMKTELSVVPRFEVKKNAVVIRIREV